MKPQNSIRKLVNWLIYIESHTIPVSVQNKQQTLSSRSIENVFYIFYEGWRMYFVSRFVEGVRNKLCVRSV